MFRADSRVMGLDVLLAFCVFEIKFGLAIQMERFNEEDGSCGSFGAGQLSTGAGVVVYTTKSDLSSNLFLVRSYAYLVVSFIITPP